MALQSGITRRDALHAGAGLAAALLLPPARACEFITSTMRITHPWTRATGPNLQSAVLCMKFDEVSRTDRLLQVVTPVAGGWELASAGRGRKLPLVIPAGRETVLAEDGLHIRLLRLQHPLLIARAYPLTLQFEVGGSVQAQLSVDYLPLPPIAAMPAAIPADSRQSV
jgi:copper(I)-binding protein